MPESVAPDQLDLAPGSELLELLRRCPEAGALRFQDGDLLIREGERSRHLLVVTRGSLVVERGAAPATVLAQLTATRDEPAILGEMAYFGEEPRSATVRCVGAAFALRLEPAHVDLALEAFPGLTRIICRQFTLRLREAIAALADLRRGSDLAPERRLLQDGEPLFRAGEPAAELFQLVLGRLRIEGPGGARSLGPEDLPGGFLELGPWLRDGSHVLTAAAEGSAFLAAVAAERRAAFLRRFPELALAVLQGGPGA